MKFFIKLREAFAVFIETVQAQTEASRDLAVAIRENTRVVLAAGSSLFAKGSTIDAIEKHVEYLAISEEHRLRRAGQKHDFKG